MVRAALIDGWLVQVKLVEHGASDWRGAQVVRLLSGGRFQAAGRWGEELGDFSAHEQGVSSPSTDRERARARVCSMR